jgi:hypothetical protein
MSTKVPEEESLINVGAEDSDSLAEDLGNVASTSITSRRWRYGLCVVGILCIGIALATRARGQASLSKTKNVNGVTQLSFFSSLTSGGSITDAFSQQFHEMKADVLEYVPQWAGGTLGDSTTLSPPLLGLAAPVASSTYGAPVAAATVAAAVSTSAGPAVGTTIINGVPYSLVASPTAATAGVTVSDASQSLPNITTATVAPAPNANQTAAQATAKSTVQADTSPTVQESSKALATESKLASPCLPSGKYADGTPCLQAYDYPATYYGSTTPAARLL